MNRSFSRRAALALLVLGWALAVPAAASTVERFSPQGEAKKVRQATARFSEPVVAFGDPRPADPFDVDCPAKGAGRWVDPRTWAYEFEQDLSAGLVCRFQLRKDMKTLAGNPVAGEAVYSFSTGGPAIVGSDPPEGSDRIDERQVFVLFVDAEPVFASLARNVSFSVSGG